MKKGEFFTKLQNHVWRAMLSGKCMCVVQDFIRECMSVNCSYYLRKKKCCLTNKFYECLEIRRFYFKADAVSRVRLRVYTMLMLCPQWTQSCPKASFSFHVNLLRSVYLNSFNIFVSAVGHSHKSEIDIKKLSESELVSPGHPKCFCNGYKFSLVKNLLKSLNTPYYF